MKIKKMKAILVILMKISKLTEVDLNKNTILLILLHAKKFLKE